jgi:hypothetical protein
MQRVDVFRSIRGHSSPRTKCRSCVPVTSRCGVSCDSGREYELRPGTSDGVSLHATWRFPRIGVWIPCTSGTHVRKNTAPFHYLSCPYAPGGEGRYIRVPFLVDGRGGGVDCPGIRMLVCRYSPAGHNGEVEPSDSTDVDHTRSRNASALLPIFDSGRPFLYASTRSESLGRSQANILHSWSHPYFSSCRGRTERIRAAL